jgi:hypothetical protein
MPAGDADLNRENPFRDRAAPDFAAALALTNEFATRLAEKMAKLAVEGARRHRAAAGRASISRSALS